MVCGLRVTYEAFPRAGICSQRAYAYARKVVPLFKLGQVSLKVETCRQAKLARSDRFGPYLILRSTRARGCLHTKHGERAEAEEQRNKS
jgi:hypothetical protein